MASELLIQYIWKNKLCGGRLLRTTCGQELEILDPGEQNFHSGPDFFNARIRLGKIIWAGNVEVHLYASQWKIHGHHLDPAYDNVILHVIHYFDLEIKNSKGRSIPALILDAPFIQDVQPEDLQERKNWLLCQSYRSDIALRVQKNWIHRLYRERLDQKVYQMTQILNRYPGDREKALFIAMASGFGLQINSLPFEMMASGIPSPLLLKIKNCLPDVEALFFGQSGLLHSPVKPGSYAASLWKRYAQLKKAAGTDPLPPHLWKFLRIRPASFPTLRLAQLASLIHLHYPLYENFRNKESVSGIEQMLQFRTNSYWNNHYIFDKPSPHSIKKLGEHSVKNLIINVIIPFTEALHRKEPQKYSGINPLTILCHMTPESNHIIKKWTNFGICPGNAMEGQALIQLYNGYCKQKRCLECEIGKLKPSWCP
ncbi:MAG: DUF2851 family protein [Bacteroidales bacterium]|nr:DUF2851 family protein [Bacteroidales bacterium]